MSIITADSITQQKALLRKEFLQKRSKVSGEYKQRLDWDIFDNFFDHIEISHFNKIALYYPIGSEVNILPFADRLEEMGKTYLLPHIIDKGRPLIFKKYRIGDPLKKGKLFDILEPADDKESLVPDLVIVPLVAYDLKCYRLGYGGGFYDRTIAYHKEIHRNITTIGVAYKILETKSLPINAFDVRLDYIVNNEEVIRA